MKTLYKLIVQTFLVVIVTPALYFAWRGAQPMELPEYNGLTYYQFLAWRSMAYEELADQYEIAHPDLEVKRNACEPAVLIVDHIGRLPMSMLYPIAAMYPAVKAIIPRTDLRFVPEENVNWSNFLPQWWLGYEKLLLDGFQHLPHTSVAYCRIHQNVPTPDEFATMQRAHEATVSISP